MGSAIDNLELKNTLNKIRRETNYKIEENINFENVVQFIK